MNHMESAPILYEYGFHCLGCIMAQYETLEEGAKAHGLNDEQINELVERINDVIEQKTKK